MEVPGRLADWQQKPEPKGARRVQLPGLSCVELQPGPVGHRARLAQSAARRLRCTSRSGLFGPGDMWLRPISTAAAVQTGRCRPGRRTTVQAACQPASLIPALFMSCSIASSPETVLPRNLVPGTFFCSSSVALDTGCVAFSLIAHSDGAVLFVIDSFVRSSTPHR